MPALLGPFLPFFLLSLSLLGQAFLSEALEISPERVVVVAASMAIAQTGALLHTHTRTLYIYIHTYIKELSENSERDLLPTPLAQPQSSSAVHEPG